MVDPTVELTQPGGPFSYGEALLTDGAGGYTIAPTFRPHFVSFSVPGRVRSFRGCKHQGVDTQKAGFVVTLPLSLIGVSVSVDQPVSEGSRFRVEVFERTEEGLSILTHLHLEAGERKRFRRDMSEPLKAGAELGARIKREAGEGESTFSSGIVVAELEG